MEAAINFYELKTRLADLGFNEPGIVDQLREAMLTEYDYTSLYTDREAARIQINLDKDNLGELQFHSYDVVLAKGKQLRDQVFAPDVPVHEAMVLLNNRLKREDVSVAVTGEPMNRQRVRASIGLHPNENNNQLTLNTMNTENLSYLQKQLLNLGFGDQMNEALEKQIKAKTPEFTLAATNEYNKQSVDYTLHFKAGDQNEMYFFNKYDASLRDKEMQQTFYINKGSGITAKEAFNLMEGRAVHKELENKEGEKYKAWITLDKENKTENGNFKLQTYSEGWNYKPERAIGKMAIVGIDTEGARDKLMKSLEKGNRHQVEAIRDGKTVKLFIEANPAEHRVNLTNYKGEARQLEHYKKPELKTDNKKDQKQTVADEGTKKKRSRGQKMSA